MMYSTSAGVPVSEKSVSGYIRSLVGRFFKILPIKESDPKFLAPYVSSLQLEMVGFGDFIAAINDDPMLISLLSVLQFLIDNPDCPTPVVRREVFRSISICNKLIDKYATDVFTEEVAK